MSTAAEVSAGEATLRDPVIEPKRPRFVVREANEGDDAAIRGLLRARPMDGLIRLALPREPDASVAAAVEGERHTTFLVERDGEVLGMGTRSVRRVYLDGEPVSMGYLGQLRVTEGAYGFKRLRAGYDRLRAARRSDEAPYDLTLIVSDNRPARRLLERGLPGMPTYRPLTEIETLILPTARAKRSRAASVRRAESADLDALLAFFARQHRKHMFAPVLSREDLASRFTGLSIEDFRILDAGGEILAAGGVWDQRAYKQAVVDGYAPWLSTLRPVVNLGLRAVGQPTLPRAGSVLPLAYLTGFAVEDLDRKAAEELVETLLYDARQRGLGQLVLTLAVDHPLTAPLRRRFRARPYRSMVYAVHWPDATLDDDLLKGSLPHLEAALL